jgi:hypothetical protein
MLASEMITELKELIAEYGDKELVKGHYEKTLDRFEDVEIDGFVPDGDKFRLV